MEVDGGLFQVVVTQQHLDAAQIRTCFEQVSGKTMANRVRVDPFFDARSLGGSFAGMVDSLGRDGPITGASMPARKQPFTGLSSQPAPVLAEFVEQHGTEHYVPVLAAFAASNVNHHALTVDVTHF